MHWRSKLIHPEGSSPAGFRSLATPTHRGSTVLFQKQREVTDNWQQTETGYSYGLYGTPTTLELAGRIAELEGAQHTFVVPCGQAAIAITYLAFCCAGSHALLPWNVYKPSYGLAQGLLRNLGIDVEQYDPLISSDIGKLIRPNTSLIWCESPRLDHDGSAGRSSHCCGCTNAWCAGSR